MLEERNWMCPVWLVILALALAPVIGIATNFINFKVSSEYYDLVLGGWSKFPLARALWQGALEGAVLGLISGVCLAVAVAAVTRLQVDLAIAFPALLVALATAVACWVVGGVAGLMWATVDPVSYAGRFPVARRATNLPAFGWVGGSIWGAYAGGVLGVVAGAGWLHYSWRRYLRQQRVRGFDVGR